MPEFKDPSSINPAPEGVKLKFNQKQLFEAIIRTIYDGIKGLAGAPSIGAGTIPAWMKAFEFNSSKEREAFYLITKSIMRAFRDQIRVEIDQLHLDEQQQLVAKNKTLDFLAFEQLKTGSYSFSLSHFQRPENLPFLKSFATAYAKWLIANFGMSPSRARGLASEYKYYFGYVFYEELRKGEYAALKQWRENNIIPKQIQLIKRQRYEAKLRGYYFAPSLGQQEVALQDVYIEPDFLVLDKLLPEAKRNELRKNNELSHQDHFLRSEFPHSIHDYFREYFMQARCSNYLGCEQEESRMMILLGQPGHGKSSFCYRTAYDLLNDEQYQGSVHLIRLRETRMEVIQNPLDEFSRLLAREELDPKTDWKNKETPSLLLLDGLDELYMARGWKEEDVREFIRSCKMIVEDTPNLFVVITSRFNYLPSDKLRQSKALVLSLATMDTAQQQKLVQQYEASGKQVTIDLDFLQEINSTGNFQHIKELIELPIILQIILISGVDLKAATSRAAIYDRLFESVLNRKWDEDGRLAKYREQNDFQPRHLREYLSFLALKIYQSPRDYLNRREINNYRETKAFIREYVTIEGEGGQMDEVLKDVLTSFYIKEKRKDDDDERDADRNHYAIEFLHKSLYEYLACEHIWSRIKEIFAGRYTDFPSIGEELQALLGHTRLSEEMLDYIKEILSKNTEVHQPLQQKMADILPEMLAYGCIYQFAIKEHDVSPRYTPSQQALHIFHGYWAVLGWLRVHEIDTTSYWDNEWEAFFVLHLKGQKLRELVAKTGIPGNYATEEDFLKEAEAWFTAEPAKAPPAYIGSFFRQKLYYQASRRYRPALSTDTMKQLTPWLRGVGAERLPFKLNFDLFDFTKMDLDGLSAHLVHLSGANLYGAYLYGVDLDRANLYGANLNGANLNGAFLSGAYLYGANLSGAYLYGAILSGANLYGANLNRADLSGANLYGANLNGANLNGAFLYGANLYGVNLSHPDQLKSLQRASVNYVANNYSLEKVEGEDYYILIRKEEEEAEGDSNQS